MTRRAIVYARISQDREGAGLGVERQRADCIALANKLGWSIVAEHTDNDLSAYSGKPRPGYRALLGEIESGRANAVIVWHTDRLHRSPRELEEYVDLCERRKVVTQTVKAGELDLSTPSGRAVARTLGAWARRRCPLGQPTAQLLPPTTVPAITPLRTPPDSDSRSIERRSTSARSSNPRRP